MPNGFAGYDIQNKSYSIIKVVDKKIPRIFNNNDFIEVKVEYITEEEFKDDSITDNEIILNAVIYEFMPRGFYTKEKDISIFKKIALYDARGYIIIPELEKRNVFEIGDMIKITIRRLKNE